MTKTAFALFLIGSALSSSSRADAPSGANPFECTAWGKTYDSTSPHHERGIAFTARAPSREEAAATAASECQQGAPPCDEPVCHPLDLVAPRPLGPDSVVSCGGEDGYQFEIMRGSNTYEGFAIVSFHDTQKSVFSISAYVPDNSPRPLSFEARSEVNELSLSLNLLRAETEGTVYFRNGLEISSGKVRCIWPAPREPRPSPGFPHHGHGH